MPDRMPERAIGDGLGLATQAELDVQTKIRQDEYINVMYPPVPYVGAKGDGTTDDYAVLQAIITYAISVMRSVFFPHGKYKITAGLIAQYSNSAAWQPGLHIYGVAPGMTQDGVTYGSILAPTSAVTGPALSVIGVPNTDNSYKGMVSGALIENLGILGVNGGTNGDGFYFKYFVNLTLRNLWSMYNKNGFTFDRQANGANFGYGFGVTLDRIFSISNRGWGIDALDAGSINLTFMDPTVQSNISGGLICAGGPTICFGGGFYGNGGHAVFSDDPSGASSIFGPHFYGTRFESNNTATLGPQVELVSANMPVFDACWFLTSTGGEHGIKMGEDGTKIVYRPTLRNCYFTGRTAVPTQNAYIIGANCQNAVIENCRETNYTNKFGGTSGLKSDLLYIEKGNQFGSPINVVLDGVARAFAAFNTGDGFPRVSINTAGDLSWGDGANAADTILTRDAADRLSMASGDSFRLAGGSWNTGNFILGTYRLWIDTSGRLRVKNGAPTSDTDGAVVGTQT